MTQKKAIEILKLGHTTFLTGGAGTGKTYVLNEFIKYLQAHSIPHAVTASTGIAATHIGGTTIHSFSGIGIKDTITSYDLDNMSSNEKLAKRLQNTKVLIIDEISMLHASRLEMLDKILKYVRKDKSPFGGMQIIFCGDFFQLPPVVKNRQSSEPLTLEMDWEDMSEDAKRSYFDKADKMTRDEYAFNSKAWKNAKPVICYLDKNYRQDDNTLTNILNMIRSASEDIYDSLEALNDTRENSLINPVRLYSHNRDVDSINAKSYKDLESEVEHEYTMISRGRKNLVDSLKQNILAPEVLKLKLGTKIIFIKNERTGKYQNGTLGIVESFDNDGYPVILLNNSEKLIAREDTWQIKDDNDAVLAEVSQLPLRYAWAITIHKSQGMTLDEAEIDLSNGFGFGMGYVALSRVRTLSGLKLSGLNNQALQVANHVLEYDKELRERSKQAESALDKYNTEDLSEKQMNKRIEMGGAAEPLTDEQVEKLAEINNKKLREDKLPTQAITLKFLLEGKTLEEVQRERDLTLNTILEHVLDISALPECVGDTKTIIDRILLSYMNEFYVKNKMKTKKSKDEFIANVKEELSAHDKMRPVFEIFKNKYTDLDYNVLKIVRTMQ